MSLNWFAVLAAAFIPLVIGFVWYHPKVLGTAWMKASDFDEEKKGMNMILLFGLSFVFAFLIAAVLQASVIHQLHLFSVMSKEPGFGKEGTDTMLFLKGFMTKYGDNHRHFGHGAIHGAIMGLLFVAPIFATNALFEKKGWKYILINVGYWTVCLTLMGGVICAWR